MHYAAAALWLLSGVDWLIS